MKAGITPILYLCWGFRNEAHWTVLCSGAQVSLLHSTAMTPSGALAVLQGHLWVINFKKKKTKSSYLDVSERSKSWMATSLRTTLCECPTYLTRVWTVTPSAALTTVAALDTVPVSTPGRGPLAQGCPPSISTLIYLSVCLYQPSMWAPSSAKRVPPSVTSPSRLRASECLLHAGDCDDNNPVLPDHTLSEPQCSITKKIGIHTCTVFNKMKILLQV